MAKDRFYLSFKCGCHHNGAIVADSLKGIIGSYADTFGRHQYVSPLKLWVASEMAKPDWWDAAVAKAKHIDEVRSTIGMTESYLSRLSGGWEKEKLVATGLVSFCPNRKPNPDRDDKDGCEWDCAVCYGYEIVPTKHTWDEIHERKKALDSLDKELQQCS